MLIFVHILINQNLNFGQVFSGTPDSITEQNSEGNKVLIYNYLNVTNVLTQSNTRIKRKSWKHFPHWCWRIYAKKF